MAEFRRVTQDFAVAAQLALADVAQARAEGFVKLINNRPDGEAPGQPTSAEIEQAARDAGLAYAFIPVVGRPTPEQAQAVSQAAEAAAGPVLAFCRSGNRSICAWAMGQAMAGKRPPRELVELGAEAGYDLSPVLGG
jgi:uncharacterized protein (TIGR01244 family)